MNETGWPSQPYTVQYSLPTKKPLVKNPPPCENPPCWKLAKPCKVLVIMSSISLAIIKWSGFIRCGPSPFDNLPCQHPSRSLQRNKASNPLLAAANTVVPFSRTQILLAANQRQLLVYLAQWLWNMETSCGLHFHMQRDWGRKTPVWSGLWKKVLPLEEPNFSRL